MEPITIAAVSCLIHAGGVDANLAQIEKWTRRAAAQGADVVLFNETCVPGYWQNVRLRSLAEPLDGSSVQRLNDLAKELDVIIAVGLIEQADGKQYNTHVLIGPRGVLGAHRKSAFPDGEEKWFDLGDDANVFDIGPYKVGIAICYESVHPETCRALAAGGAQVILAPYANGVTAKQIKEGKRRYFEQRARENGVWYVACDQCSIDRSKPARPLVPGAVCFVDPTGRMVATTKLDEKNEHMIVCRLDPGFAKGCRPASHPVCSRPVVRYLSYSSKSLVPR